LKGILPENHNFQGGERLILFLIGPLIWGDETHVSLQRQPPVLEALATRTLFPYENQLRFLMKYFLQLRCFKVEVGSVCSKRACKAEMMKHMCLSKENHEC
jgi:hypothetical protein